MHQHLTARRNPCYGDRIMEESRFERFSTLIESSIKSIIKLKGTYMDAYSLSATHARCLTALLKHESLTQNQLSEYLSIDRSQISRILKDTIAAGLIRTDDTSPYKKAYHLTDAGKNSRFRSLLSSSDPQKMQTVMIRTATRCLSAQSSNSLNMP